MDTFVIEEALRDRECSHCPKKIRKGEEHFAVYYPTQYGHSKRHNYCRRCALQFIKIEIKRLVRFEEKISNING